MRKLLHWLRPSVEGDDGKASYRRLSALVLLALMVYITAAAKITTTIGLYVLITHAVTFLLLVGIMTIDNILTFVENCKGKFKDKDKE